MLSMLDGQMSHTWRKEKNCKHQGYKQRMANDFYDKEEEIISADQNEESSMMDGGKTDIQKLSMWRKKKSET